MAQHNLTPIADVISAGAIVGTLLNVLPPLAALIAILWYFLQIYESKTVQGFLHRRKTRRHRHRLRAIRAAHPKTKPPPVT